MNEMKWIPVKERLPEKPEDGKYPEYICTARWENDKPYGVGLIEWGKVSKFVLEDLEEYGDNDCEDRIYDGYAFGDAWSNGIEDCMDVIAWMPLPEPYEEVSE